MRKSANSTAAEWFVRLQGALFDCLLLQVKREQLEAEAEVGTAPLGRLF